MQWPIETDSSSSVAFELYSTDFDAVDFPSDEDLWVRFIYRNSTNANAPLSEYPLFGLANTTTGVKYNDFTAHLREFSVNLSEWCKICGSITSFCSTVQRPQMLEADTPSSDGSQNDMSPSVAAGIGVFFGISISVIFTVLLALFGGFTVTRIKAPARNSGWGGSRGVEKRTPDRDLIVSRTGAKRERVGSWELGGSDNFGRAVANYDTPMGATYMRGMDDDGDSLLIGRGPVKPFTIV